MSLAARMHYPVNGNVQRRSTNSRKFATAVQHNRLNDDDDQRITVEVFLKRYALYKFTFYLFTYYQWQIHAGAGVDHGLLSLACKPSIKNPNHLRL